MYLSAYPLQLGLYFNKWANPTYGIKIKAGDKFDLVLTKLRNVLFSREGTVCNEDIDEGGNIDCIFKWIQRTYVDNSSCSRGQKWKRNNFQQNKICFFLNISVCTFPQMRYFASDLGLPACATLEGILSLQIIKWNAIVIVITVITLTCTLLEHILFHFRFGMYGIPLLLQHIREDDGHGCDGLSKVLHHRRVLRGDKGILGCQLSLKVRIEDISTVLGLLEIYPVSQHFLVREVVIERLDQVLERHCNVLRRNRGASQRGVSHLRPQRYRGSHRRVPRTVPWFLLLRGCQGRPPKGAQPPKRLLCLLKWIHIGKYTEDIEFLSEVL